MKPGKLEEKLNKYSNDNYSPFHMPGHKRNEAFAVVGGINRLDITEIEGFDNYHHPTGILKEEFGIAGKIYGAKKSYYLVNGCSGGILAAISGVFSRGDRILVGRNCHKTVYNAIYFQELEPVYIYPEKLEGPQIYLGINPKDVDKLLKENPEVKGVVITSPTYEGVVSDIKAISEIVHSYGIPLIVDEAHGAHFGWGEFPVSSLKLGADIVIQGLHKTMPSLTQTGIMHVNGELVDIDKIDRYISMYQTTSPSYLFMASISTCLNTVNNDGDRLFSEYGRELSRLRNALGELKKLELFQPKSGEAFDYDKSKIVIYTGKSSTSGHKLYEDLICKYKIQPEMASLDYIILMTSICDKVSDYDRLIEALKSIDATLIFKKSNTKIEIDKNEIFCNSYKAMNMPLENVLIQDAVDRVAGDYVLLYPPGIPIIVPGEVITKNITGRIKDYKAEGLEIIGLKGENADQMSVVTV